MRKAPVISIGGAKAEPKISEVMQKIIAINNKSMARVIAKYESNSFKTTAISNERSSKSKSRF